MAVGASARHLKLEDFRSQTIAELRTRDGELTAKVIGGVVATGMFVDSELHVNATNAAGMAVSVGREVFAHEDAASEAGKIAAAQFEALRSQS